MTFELFGPPQHIGMVVDDVGAAKKAWGEVTGLDWRDYPRRPLEWTLPDGSTVVTEMTVAYSTNDSCAVELIQEHGAQPLLPDPTGHHVGFIVPDMTEARKQLEANGLTVYAQLLKDGRPLAAYYTNPHGLLVEIAVPDVAAALH
ncbi:VOC family protein [Streptomyces sp. E5N91]|uniref:VOC family protein n=1 Tax=Streptomyces sp. E5N91 TaxID=1851996 RepID=UPI00187D262B|nr:VOC family protein [Streptomyces sp. E5N91]